MQKALLAHLKTGSTTVCRAWRVIRKDGHVLGFTDHDCDLSFDGVTFSARTGLTAGALEKSTGLAVDNTEVMGALSDVAIREEDIRAGRYDGAEITAYLVNWETPEERSVLFRGHFGEMTWGNGEFRVELRGLTQTLNQPRGRVYHPECGAVLGDNRCRINTSLPDYSRQVPLLSGGQSQALVFAPVEGLAEGWFNYGLIVVETGGGAGQTARIKADYVKANQRIVELWHSLPIALAAGDRVRLVAGCDRRASTCRTKFGNFLNFRGFPHIPGEDWLRAGPVSRERM